MSGEVVARKLVPVEPTEEMWKAGAICCGEHVTRAIRTYAAMIAAAPSPEPRNDYAELQTAFDECSRLSVLRWRVILELQAKLDAVTKDAESWREWKAAQARVEEEMPEGYAITMHCSPGDWDIDLVDPSNKRIEIHDYDDVTNFFNRSIDAAITEQGRAGEGRSDG